MRLIFVSFILMFAVDFSKAQEEFFNTDINDLEQNLAAEERPVLLFFTAAWCKYCRSMKADVFSDSSIIDLSQSFYTVVFPYEYEKEVSYLGNRYSYIPTGIDQGYHEFTETFAKNDGSINYPTLVIMWKGKKVVIVDHYLDKETLQKLLLKFINAIED